MIQEVDINKYFDSCETKKRINDFVKLLKDWNEKINLVSKKSIDDIWIRHVLDSAQLIDFITRDNITVVDIGSGSGFPGIVLSILLTERNINNKIYLVESIQKKAMYLNDVCKKLCLNNTFVKNSRIENCVFKDVDVIVVRAVAQLNILFEYASIIGNEKTLLILPKGKSYQKEIDEANKKWLFKIKINKNKYSEDGVILEVTNLRKKK